jgi:hypothetical protein
MNDAAPAYNGVAGLGVFLVALTIVMVGGWSLLP